MLYPSIGRDWSGIYIEGQQIGLRVLPNPEGTIRVDVHALPALTGFDRSCCVAGDERLEFAPTGIVVYDTRLECFTADRFVPFMRRGFTLEIEPGMAQALRTLLPKITSIATASKTIADRFSDQLAPPVHHMFDAITSVAARIALGTYHKSAPDGRPNITWWSVDESIRYEREYGVWRANADFMALFDDESVRQALNDLVPAP